MFQSPDSTIQGVGVDRVSPMTWVLGWYGGWLNQGLADGSEGVAMLMAGTVSGNSITVLGGSVPFVLSESVEGKLAI